MDAFDDKSLKPMLIGKEGPPFDDDSYYFELKLDGERCLAYLDDAGTVLINRRGSKVLPKMPELAGIHKQAAKKCILDGELVVTVDGRLDFDEINRRWLMSNKASIDMASKTRPATFVAFDILYSEGKLLTERPLHERKRLLEDIVRENDRISVSRYVEGQGVQFFELVRKKGMEGIVAKSKHSIYYPGKRTSDWIKIKNLLEDDFVVCGYLQKSEHIASIVLGQYDEYGTLFYAGHAALAASREDFKKIKAQEKTNAQPFGQKLPPGNENAVWIEPSLVCIVSFLNRTAGGGLRHPLYKGLRLDKAPKEAVYIKR